jgi:glycosyltransferase involved in cell wall biosynthesis
MSLVDDLCRRNPVRLTILVRQLNLGGAQRQLFQLVKRLDKNRFSISVVTFYDGGFFREDLGRLPGVKYVCLNKKGRWDLFLFLLRAVKTFRVLRPDVIYSFMGGANILASMLKPFLNRTRVVWGVRGSAVESGEYDWTARITARLENWFSCFPETIITNSKAGEIDAKSKGFPSGKLKIIPNGIDCETFRPQPEVRHRIRREWGIGEREKVVGLVGRWDPMKDHANFLRAGRILQKNWMELRLVIVGAGDEKPTEELRFLFKKFGLEAICLYVGQHKDMPAVYNGFDVLVSSSAFGEGGPNVVGEAMACGTPCVVTDVGDSAWLVGDTGAVVPPRDPENLADAVHRILKSLECASELREQARSRIMAEFDLDRMVADTDNVLKGSTDRIENGLAG